MQRARGEQCCAASYTAVWGHAAPSRPTHRCAVSCSASQLRAECNTALRRAVRSRGWASVDRALHSLRGNAARSGTHRHECGQELFLPSPMASLPQGSLGEVGTCECTEVTRLAWFIVNGRTQINITSVSMHSLRATRFLGEAAPYPPTRPL
ncbi:hypothetical protein E2C01_096237 [Portunus trituberculatus]|uniref:Uncharacterized protein n=1 Tax=Portunus trituberculatus TaxID=210409 RepID=A0A5B7JXG1_PORTR|nr:hypothetical protein [Portunus trituberculatus]